MKKIKLLSIVGALGIMTTQSYAELGSVKYSVPVRMTVASSVLVETSGPIDFGDIEIEDGATSTARTAVTVTHSSPGSALTATVPLHVTLKNDNNDEIEVLNRWEKGSGEDGTITISGEDISWNVSAITGDPAEFELVSTLNLDGTEEIGNYTGTTLIKVFII
ncbi:hypothetical protein PM10SUCC1_09090 [Propionigenium maris DSM 9537]|uniref:Uncharacterized protein n=1 Tax=Propionigenium maris DSM 9537 TaxID=1123000 RepID=A0A9W6GK21_9FUSO|nr:hypothetical protein [Propionigenium maris]GLI55395.1 hypothetical protein PM10SUCC1_09090 [Propionigenium maris DSM 9537]